MFRGAGAESRGRRRGRRGAGAAQDAAGCHLKSRHRQHGYFGPASLQTLKKPQSRANLAYLENTL